uniref:Uncharacterized protein n=1 Tax=Prevotella sp. GTC17259 TaxID=3236795 RepID=A0AB33JAW6_9BACT
MVELKDIIDILYFIRHIIMEEAVNTITTISEATNLIERLQTSCTPINKEILAAQLQVLRSISSPELVGSTFDLMLSNIKDVITSSESDSFKEIFRKNSILLIQNYLFFMKAKLVYIRSTLEKEDQRLMREKFEILRDATKCVTTTLNNTLEMVALSKGKIAIQIELLSLSKHMEEKGLIDRIFDWFSRKEIQKQNKKKSQQLQQEFDKSIGLLTVKLYSYHKYLGSSTIISGIIENYKKEIYEYFDPDKVARNNKIEKTKSAVQDSAIGVFSVNLFLSAVIYLLIIIVPSVLWVLWTLFGASVDIFESWLDWGIHKASVYGFYYLAGSNSLIVITFVGLCLFKIKPLVKESHKTEKEVQQKYDKLCKTFASELDVL